MYTNVWSKYLPIIRIVMKRSLAAEQILALNAGDFERAGMKRKSGYKFSFGLKQGKLKHVIIDLPLASSLASVLLEDKAVNELIQTNEFHFTLSPKYELTIRHIPQPEAIVEA
jgi:DNA polymerase III sliding clamp (beta) subunit (PCNA family)